MEIKEVVAVKLANDYRAEIVLSFVNKVETPTCPKGAVINDVVTFSNQYANIVSKGNNYYDEKAIGEFRKVGNAKIKELMIKNLKEYYQKSWLLEDYSIEGVDAKIIPQSEENFVNFGLASKKYLGNIRIEYKGQVAIIKPFTSSSYRNYHTLPTLKKFSYYNRQSRKITRQTVKGLIKVFVKEVEYDLEVEAQEEAERQELDQYIVNVKKIFKENIGIDIISEKNYEGTDVTFKYYPDNRDAIIVSYHRRKNQYGFGGIYNLTTEQVKEIIKIIK